MIQIVFVLPFENETDREVHTKFYLPTEEIKDYNVIIDGLKHMITLERLQLVKEMITQLDVY